MDGTVPPYVKMAMPTTEPITHSATAERTIQVFDFFAGCGGGSAGFQNAGLIPVFALDFDPYAAASYQANFPDARVEIADIRNFPTEALAPEIEIDRLGPTLFAACAPCQPFSKQNRQKQTDDCRASLLDELERFLERWLPEFVMVENVPGIQTFAGLKDGPLARFTATLSRLGYYYSVAIVRAQDYGVPQTRRRLVLMASRLGAISHPPPTHGTSDRPHRTVRDAIAHLPPLSAGEMHGMVPDHCAARLSDLNLARIRGTGIGRDRRDWSLELQLDCHRNVKGFTDVYGRMAWDRPAPSLTTRCISLSNGRFGHPEQDRAISVREAACIQTFAEDYSFAGGMAAAARQIGNAVPPRLAEVMGQAFLDHARKYGALSG